MQQSRLKTMTIRRQRGHSDPDDLPDSEVDQRFAELSTQFADLGTTGGGPRDYSLTEPENTFTPPPLPPARRTGPAAVWGAVLGVTVLLLLALGFAGITLPWPVTTLFVVIVLICVVQLIRQLPRRRDHDSDDEGARI